MVQNPNDELITQLRQLRPWHHVVQIRDQISTANAYDQFQEMFAAKESRTQNGTAFRDGQVLAPSQNDSVALIDVSKSFHQKLKWIYPDGLEGKSFLDCACNCGAYCFWALENGCSQAVGFDVRDHWIQQAKFLKRERDLATDSRIEFTTCDLYNLPELQLPEFDFVLFKGIFYHLPSPIAGLKIAADRCKDVLWLNTASVWEAAETSLKTHFEGQSELMSGVHKLSFLPGGPQVLCNILAWMGFRDFRLILNKQTHVKENLGRFEIFAARESGRVDGLPDRFEKLVPQSGPSKLKPSKIKPSSSPSQIQNPNQSVDLQRQPSSSIWNKLTSWGAAKDCDKRLKWMLGPNFHEKKIIAAGDFSEPIQHWIRQNAARGMLNRRLDELNNVEPNSIELLILHNSLSALSAFSDPLAQFQKLTRCTSQFIWINELIWTGGSDADLHCELVKREGQGDATNGLEKFSGRESGESSESSEYRLEWTAGGAEAIAKILYWSGFKDVRICRRKRIDSQKNLERIEILAGRELDRFDSMPPRFRALRMDASGLVMRRVDLTK